MHENLNTRSSRDALANRVANAQSSFTGLWAPAGFEKGNFARSLADRYEGAQELSARGVHSADELISKVSAGLPALIVTDADDLDDTSLERALRELLAVGIGKLVVSRRREPHFSFAESIAPHHTTIIRRGDLSLAFSDLQTLGQTYGVSDRATLFRIHQLAHGWPAVARYILRLAADGLMNPTLPPFSDKCWVDLWDWIDANVVKHLGAREFDALCYCVVRTDTKPSDRHVLTPACAQALTRDTQLADIGFAGEIRILPFVRHFLYFTHFDSLQREGREAAADLLGRGERTAAARVLVNVGALAEASEIVSDADDHAATLGNYPYPGITLELLAGRRPSYVLYPAIWYGLVTARRYVAPLSVLADEADEILAALRAKSGALTRFLMVGALLHSLCGNVERAEDLAEELDAAVADEAVRDIAWMYVEIARGDDARALERWERSGSWLLRNPTAYVLALMEADRLMYRFGSKGRARQGLRTMWSIATSSGSPFAGAAAALAKEVRSLSDDSDDVCCAELAPIVANYDVPALWRLRAAFLGIDYQEEPAGSATNGSLALFALIERETDVVTRRSYAMRFVECSDALRSPYLRVLSRAVAYLTGALGAGAIGEACAIAERTGIRHLIAPLRALVSHGGDLGPLRRIAQRIAKAPKAIAAIATGDVCIDFCDGSVTQSGRVISLSRHSYALVIALAVEPTASREKLADRFWQDLDGDAASNALKTCVQRTRAQLGGTNAITVERGHYNLGASISSNYRELIALGSTVLEVPLDAPSRIALSIAFDRFFHAPHQWPQDWTWFAPHERALAQAACAIGNTLIRDDLVRGDRSGAIQRARAIVAQAPLNEAPRLALIELLDSGGDHAGAAQEYFDYRFVLLRELGTTPPRSLEALAERLQLRTLQTKAWAQPA